jgi:hypothetical protein
MSQIDKNHKFMRSNRKILRRAVKFLNVVMAVAAIVKTINTIISSFFRD